MIFTNADACTHTAETCPMGRSCHEYEKLICAIAYKLTNDKESACQLAAMTFQKALEAQEELRELEHPKAWLLTTLRESYRESFAGAA